MKTIKVRVLAEKVFDARENRYAHRGDVIELPATVLNHERKLVPVRLNPEAFEVIADKRD